MRQDPGGGRGRSLLGPEAGLGDVHEARRLDEVERTRATYERCAQLRLSARRRWRHEMEGVDGRRTLRVFVAKAPASGGPRLARRDAAPQ